MLITLQNKDFNIKNINVLEKVPNTIIKESEFYKIMYEENEISINGIYLYHSWEDCLGSFLKYIVQKILNMDMLFGTFYFPWDFTK